MELEEFVQNFAEQFSETPADEVSADTVFHDLDGWSSMTALDIISMVDEEYDVAIKGNDIRSCTTVRDLYEIVRGRKQ